MEAAAAAARPLEYTFAGAPFTGNGNSAHSGRRRSSLLPQQQMAAFPAAGAVSFPASPPFSPHRIQVLGTEVRVAARRRRADIQSDTYVLMEPGMDEEFVTREELEDRLTGWLERWPGGELPPDLARFETVDAAVSYLVRSVCELEIDGEVGSVQWYQVQIE